MAKRFAATEIWDEDWFLDLPNEYKLFWFYMLSTCDHAGFFKVNLRSFCALNNVKITTDTAIEKFNMGKERVRVLKEGFWFIEDFIVFQYGHTLNVNNRLHKSVLSLLAKFEVNLRSIRGLKDLKEGVKDKDKDKEIVVEKREEKIDFRRIGLVPDMVKKFKETYPYYPVDEEQDYSACLSIAYKIAKQKEWSKDSVLNGNMKETLDIWSKIVAFSTEDKWYARRSISDFNKEFQRIVQGMVQSKKNTPGEEKKERSSAPPLTRINPQ